MKTLIAGNFHIAKLEHINYFHMQWVKSTQFVLQCFQCKYWPRAWKAWYRVKVHTMLTTFISYDHQAFCVVSTCSELVKSHSCSQYLQRVSEVTLLLKAWRVYQSQTHLCWRPVSWMYSSPLSVWVCVCMWEGYENWFLYQIFQSVPLVIQPGGKGMHVLNPLYLMCTLVKFRLFITTATRLCLYIVITCHKKSTET